MKFDEKNYLEKYPDVQEAVKRGDFKSGLDHYENFGRAEGRTDKDFHNDLNLSERDQKVLKGLNLKNGKGLEIGPSHNPVAPKSKGFNVEIVDHLSKAGLIQKYETHPGVDVSKIEEVDYIWDGRPLGEVVGDKERFDWIIASHVIEHTPCLVSFLQQCFYLLKDKGILSLVAPDKRFCFDHLNEISSVGEVLDTFILEKQRPSPGKIYEYLANAVNLNGKIAWSSDEKSSYFKLIHKIEDAKLLFEESQNTDEYHDVHVWRFIPESLIFILEELKYLGLITFDIFEKPSNSGCEFYLKLIKTKDFKSSERDRLRELMNIRDILKR